MIFFDHDQADRATEIIRAADRLRQGVTPLRLSEPDSPDAQALRSIFSHCGPEVLSWSPAELDPHRLNVWAQVVRGAWMIGVKSGIETGRERERRRLVEELCRRLRVKSSEPLA